ncbi:hypothetical protein N9B94_02800 [Verrucomicrobia bacterium]|nr:hypothetical protein [Verrucomicrobiota bacterium]
MQELQEIYDDAMLDFSCGDYDKAIKGYQSILAKEPEHFDAQLALGMAWYRKENYLRAIEEGHKAELLAPKEQLVHTNLSLFYMKSGNKETAEHHGMKARIASWQDDTSSPQDSLEENSELKMAGETPQPIKVPSKFPDMPWKKKKPTP